MAGEKSVEIPLANVARVVLVTEDAQAASYAVRTASEIELKAFISEGEEAELRKGNRLIAQTRTEDLVKGYDVTLKDVVMNPQVFALVDGGVSQFKEPDGAFLAYTGPKMGEVVARTPCTLHIYTEEKDADGETVGYLCVTCKHCKGTPASIGMKDGEFFAPEYTLRSRPKCGETPLSVTAVDALPQ